MKIKIYQRNFQPHATSLLSAFQKGLARHGLKSEWLYDKSYKPSDLAIIWGMRFPNVIEGQKQNSSDFLVMERGYIGDRTKFTSIGFNGLNGRAEFHAVNMPSDRWGKHGFQALMKPWDDAGLYILLIGQVDGDNSVKGRINMKQWLSETACQLNDNFPAINIVFRPHPLSRQGYLVKGTSKSHGSLADDLYRARMCVTFNSNTGVDAVLAGTPTVTLDRGAMAYDVTSHDLTDWPTKPDRTQWAYDMAYKQWTEEEIANGDAWDHLKRRYA